MIKHVILSVIVFANALALQACFEPPAAAKQKQSSMGVLKPDVVVVSVSYAPTTIVNGNTVTFSAVVKNQGNAATPAGTAIGVGFMVDGTGVSWALQDVSLAAGATMTLTATNGPDGDGTWLATAGNHIVTATVDNVDRFAESNETNNARDLSFSVSTDVAHGVKAVMADDFVESIGVNTHLSWGNTVWDTKSAEWMPILGESGIRYVRALLGKSALAKNLLTQLHNNYGIRADATFNLRNSSNRLDPSQIGPALTYLRDQIGVEKIVSLEGGNEYNETKYDGNSGWADQLRTFQSQLYSQAKADSAIAHIPILAPSVWKNLLADYAELGNIDAFCDLGTLHYYTGGRQPTITGLNGGSYTMDDAIGWAKGSVPSAPVTVTETGYNNMTDNVDSPYATPELGQAKYSLRMYAEFFKRRDKVVRTYMYNFMDNPGVPDKVYGFLAQPVAPATQLRRKPVFYAVKNAIKIMEDAGSNFTTGFLDYSLTGDKTNIGTVVAQKRNGRFYLMIWQDVNSVDRTASPPQNLNPARRTLALDISSHHFSKVNIYEPTAVGMANPNDGSLPVRSVLAPYTDTVNLAVPDHVMIVEMIP